MRGGVKNNRDLVDGKIFQTVNFGFAPPPADVRPSGRPCLRVLLQVKIHARMQYWDWHLTDFFIFSLDRDIPAVIHLLRFIFSCASSKENLSNSPWLDRILAGACIKTKKEAKHPDKELKFLYLVKFYQGNCAINVVIPLIICQQPSPLAQ